MTSAPKDIAASVRARLLRITKELEEDHQLVLVRYANERFLYRLSVSPYAEDFVLKGATLFMLWSGEPHRATRDIDLLGFGEATEDRVRGVFAEVLAQDVAPDGVSFDAGSIAVAPIREGKAYQGIRTVMTAHIGKARVRVQVDIGFGDTVTPEPVLATVPTLLDFPPPRLRAYSRESVVAEKLEALVQLGAATSRMKDLYDLDQISCVFPFEGSVLTAAIRSTFERRRTPFPVGLPVGLTPEFAADPAKVEQWEAFLRKSNVGTQQSLGDTVASAALRLAKMLSAPLRDSFTLDSDLKSVSMAASE